jgi:4-hydroxy-3-methylbut-2-enyl diphosphate reductase IspH
MLHPTNLVLVDQFEKKVVLHEEEKPESSVQGPTSDVILNAHGVNPRIL